MRRIPSEVLGVTGHFSRRHVRDIDIHMIWGRLITVTTLMAAIVWQAIVPCCCVVCCHSDIRKNVDGWDSQPAMDSRCRNHCSQAAQSEYHDNVADQSLTAEHRDSCPKPEPHDETCRKVASVPNVNGKSQSVDCLYQNEHGLQDIADWVIPSTLKQMEVRCAGTVHSQFSMKMIAASRLQV